MPYDVRIGKAVICPPKCGTCTTQELWQRLGYTMECQDHQPASAMLRHLHQKHGDVPMEWAMTVRHPEQRLASMVNSQLNGRNGNVHDVLQKAITTNWILTRPQSWFIEDGPENLVLFRFSDDLPICRWFGWGDTIPRINESRGTIELEELRREPLWDEAMALYAHDWELWKWSIP